MLRNYIRIRDRLIGVLIILLAFNCSNNDDPTGPDNTAVPVVTTITVTGITQTTAESGGNITSDGGARVTARGVCRSIHPAPTIADDKTIDGLGTGSLSASITGLTPNTQYYVRAYGTNSVGTGYGNSESFATLPGVPVLVTASVTGITQTAAESGGSITSDGGAMVTARGVCWSTSPTPTVSDNRTTDGTGTGSFTSSVTGLTAGTQYYVRAYGTNSVGTGYGNTLSLSGTVTDIDGNVYQIVIIGTQAWLAENLKVTHYRNGDAILNVWTDTAGAYSNYGNDESHVATYGRLYNWYAVDDSRRIAPEGWHVPSDDEWKQLEMSLGMSQSEADRGGNWGTGWRGTDEGGKLKEAGNTHWTSPNTGATNESGFSALPGGYRSLTGRYYSIGVVARFWTATPFFGWYAFHRMLESRSSAIMRDVSDNYRNYYQTMGFSVRCVRD